MRHTIRSLVVGAALLLGVAACANLDVINQDNANKARALATPGDVESLIAGAFNTWFNGTYSYYGPGLFLSNQSFQHAAPWANAGMYNYGALPRIGIVNDAADQFYGNFTRPWYYMYRAIAAVSDGLRSLQDSTVADVLNNDTPNSVTRDRAFAYFVLGMAHASLAILYDKAFIIDQNTDILAPQTASSYTDVLNAGMGYFDKAIQLCDSATFTLPTSWMSTPDVTVDNTLLAQIAHSEKARFMAAVARTPSERKAVDWNAVMSNVDAGVTSTFDIYMDANNGWYDDELDYGTYDGWEELPYWIYGMADQSGSYQRWLNQPLASKSPNPPDGDIVIVTPDLRFPRGNTIAQQRDTAADGSQINIGRYFSAPSDIGGVWAHPERGTWRWSYYYNYRYQAYNNTEAEEIPEIPIEEMNLLKAEGLYYQDDLAQVATIINRTRTANGLNATDASGTNTSCVPKVPDGDGTSASHCGGLFEMLKWEKRMEMQYTGLYGAPWWFDSRGWGDLWKDTPLEFPVPCKELQTLKILPCYSFGGSGGTMSAPVSGYDYPGENG
jgi:hypothetical protein